MVPFRVVALRAAGGLVLAGALHASCRTPTQIELVVTTDLSCAEIRDVAIVAGAPDVVELAAPSTVTQDCRDVPGGAEIGTLVIAPEGAKDTAVGIKVVAGVNSRAEDCNVGNEHAGCIVARRRLNYVPHSELVLQIPLSRDCLDQDCDPKSTCVDGGCVDSTVSDPGSCTGDGCGEEQLGGGTPGTGGGPGVGGSGLGGGGGGDGGGPSVTGTFEVLPLPAGATEAEVEAVSDDGQTIVGACYVTELWRPCAWYGGQAQVLSTPGGTAGRAQAISDDGFVIVGWGGNIQDDASLKWEKVNASYGQYQILGDTEISRAFACDDTCSLVGGSDGVGFPVVCVTSGALSCTNIGAAVGAVRTISGDGVYAGGDVSGQAWLWQVSDLSPAWSRTIDGSVLSLADGAAVMVGEQLQAGFYVSDPTNGGASQPLSGGKPRAVAGTASSFTAVGTCTDHACKWSSGDPSHSIQSTVTADYQGFTLLTATDLTDDSNVIVGLAQGPMNGTRQPYRLVINP